MRPSAHPPRRARAHVLAAALLASACGTAVPPAPRADQVYAVPLLGQSKGPADALVTLIEAGDFECPFCKTQAATLRQLAADYPTALRLLFAHLPLFEIHARALPAAVAAECAAAQDAFWPYHDALYAGAPRLDDDDLARYAADLGLDLGRWRACLEGPAAREAVNAQRARLLAFGVQATPSFFINGRFVLGGQSLAALRARVDEALAEARTRIGRDGLAAADYYQRAVLDQGLPAGD